jgi:hypothetical protein
VLTAWDELLEVQHDYQLQQVTNDQHSYDSPRASRG